MVDKEIIEYVFNTVVSSFRGKCRPPIDEVAFSKLRTNEEIAEFFNLEYLPNGKPNQENTGFNENIAFYDKRNHCIISFLTHEDMKIKGLDFSNEYVDDGSYEGEYVANLKDAIRAYYEAPYILKKATWLIQLKMVMAVLLVGIVICMV